MGDKTEDATLQSVEARLTGIERLLQQQQQQQQQQSIATSGAASGAAGVPFSQSVANVAAKLKAAVEGRPALASLLLKNGTQLNTLLDARAPESAAAEQLALSAPSKSELILASEPLIASTVTALQELETLTSYVNTPRFEEAVQQMQGPSQPLANAQVAQLTHAQTAKLIEQQFTAMLEKYTQLVTALSSQFVAFDRIITQAETTVAALEQRVAK
ncbi:hypothetical protein CAOG_08068 [Capsaspora owczarzaki ATCC 30864]|uniref:Uncharacterized protein n=1 Tax=Capsaspora owczarzaki (strain ATCC 30864) TaxID=595528 RepID=A0A0D2WXN5_CAPO3|nr:hypothetical protein CAOG_08068 [Capsaspora owczarzaki ATCC 30864]KJE98010.1 hypothetical protein CAOG_008068 [Capsaspora owczarzaki ATCC 30864]|eukprot:XP_004342669.1 hypothetical protein CAOG_08068 [Capsaspora owczarzaki ATCC 30864]